MTDKERNKRKRIRLKKKEAWLLYSSAWLWRSPWCLVGWVWCAANIRSFPPDCFIWRTGLLCSRYHVRSPLMCLHLFWNQPSKCANGLRMTSAHVFKTHFLSWRAIPFWGGVCFAGNLCTCLVCLLGNPAQVWGIVLEWMLRAARLHSTTSPSLSLSLWPHNPFDNKNKIYYFCLGVKLKQKDAFIIKHSANYQESLQRKYHVRTGVAYKNCFAEGSIKCESVPEGLFWVTKRLNCKAISKLLICIDNSVGLWIIWWGEKERVFLLAKKSF